MPGRVVVTGAARGLGLGLARAHAAAGWQVHGTRRGGHEGEAGLAWHDADVTDPASLAALAASLPGPIDRLVCNAGVYPGRGADRPGALPPEAWATAFAQAFAVNVTGVFLTVQALLPALRAGAGTGTGRQVAILGSQMGGTGRAPGGAYAYRASKAAVLNLGRNLAADLAGDGIAVGVWHPGWVRTDMGGPEAEIGPDEAVAGLMARFDLLTPERSGLWEDWTGTALAF